MSDDSLSAVESLYFRWRAFRTAGRAVEPAALCRDRPDLLPALAERIAAEHVDDTPGGTGDYTPAPARAAEPDDADGTGAYQPALAGGAHELALADPAPPPAPAPATATTWSPSTPRAGWAAWPSPSTPN
jgi:hypothetical protein